MNEVESLMYSHLAPIRALQFKQTGDNSLLSVDQNHVICIWETPRSE